MRRSVSTDRAGRWQAAAGLLAVIALAVSCPQRGRAQAMVRDEPALGSTNPGEPADPGEPSVSVNGSATRAGDATVRQPESAAMEGRGFAPAGMENDVSVVDLTGGRGAAVMMERAKWRPIFYLDTGIAYNDNIFIRSHKTGDFITTFSPGIILALGDFRDVLPHLGGFQHVYDVPTDTSADNTQRFIYLDYHPTVYLFANNGSQNAVDESANLLGGYNFAKLNLGIQAQYQKLSVEDVDAGNRINRDFYTLALTSLYQYDDKTSWEFNFYTNDREYQAPYDSSTEVISRNYLDYAYGPKTQLSVGFAAAYVNYRNAANQTYQQLLARITSVQFAKLNFTLDGGLEFRQDSGSTDTVNGIFDLNLNDQPTDSTTFAILATRDTEPSALENEDVTYTRVGLELQQRFLSRIYLSLRTSYANAKYQGVTSDAMFARTDNIEEIYTSLDTDLTQYATLQLSYTFRNDSSSERGFSFTENIVSLEVRATY